MMKQKKSHGTQSELKTLSLAIEKHSVNMSRTQCREAGVDTIMYKPASIF